MQIVVFSLYPAILLCLESFLVHIPSREKGSKEQSGELFCCVCMIMARIMSTFYFYGPFYTRFIENHIVNKQAALFCCMEPSNCNNIFLIVFLEALIAFCVTFWNTTSRHIFRFLQWFTVITFQVGASLKIIYILSMIKNFRIYLILCFVLCWELLTVIITSKRLLLLPEHHQCIYEFCWEIQGFWVPFPIM